ncbi:hypothetical protein SCRDD08_00654 [Streptococcus cristatus]|uniref:Uncharacterized protein n=1 Tax=Streptococcus cristatus TaxID=45634 RepID=A0A139N3J4_STRCR|nr:hypothetical protein SCRDD08_00654 [Streptococcus cristatus]
MLDNPKTIERLGLLSQPHIAEEKIRKEILWQIIFVPTV